MTIDVDLWDHDAFQRQEHHELLAQLRETDPGVHWVDEGDEGRATGPSPVRPT